MPTTAPQPLYSASRYYQSLTQFVKRPKITIYTGAIFSLLAVSLFGWYAIRPTLQTILFLRREIVDNTLVSRQMEEKISKLIEASSVYQTIKPRLPLLTQALPDDPVPVTVLAQLKLLATDAGATVSAITVAPVPLSANQEKSAPGKGKQVTRLRAPKKVADTTVTMVAGGTYDTLKTVLSRIIAQRRILSVDTITITPDKTPTGGGSTGDVKLRMVVKLHVHYLTP